jgi:uncharacterized protein YeeX (DUF496 family)
MTEPFTLDELDLIQESIRSFKSETSRSLDQQTKMKPSTGSVRGIIEETKTKLSKKLDDLSILEAKMIVNRRLLTQVSEQPEAQASNAPTANSNNEGNGN